MTEHGEFTDKGNLGEFEKQRIENRLDSIRTKILHKRFEKTFDDPSFEPDDDEKKEIDRVTGEINQIISEEELLSYAEENGTPLSKEDMDEIEISAIEMLDDNL